MDFLIHTLSKINELLERQLFAATAVHIFYSGFYSVVIEGYKVLSPFLSILCFSFYFIFFSFKW